ncbi:MULTISPECIES: siroheme synthase CysG [unclassified Beijerinckia]|uniref:siroheme synthase CysG n=1 Tax=unclassified Beijerinckia TaxID=2638183 RepID=UPI000899A722|nr:MULTISPECIES: siroheme synthase CysG [unclassified Beijerinckia]MDH7794358.1 uroporphyrin-III C-methyltransferase/precorrin-2 dehydrogenase/sirohydrochlorin ferrochelatase [Beijerinckia sp. GAS462]SEB59849.1 uroporphyrin-III C-methyltransferase / precorrin-2 dehydrogenase / sirohydrochlorin ferrochelatase [Beijerinckia sp. 28-YEA-48]
MSNSTWADLPEQGRRIDALSSLPLFHKLQGASVLLAGQGDALTWKAELLAAAGAHVVVVTDETFTSPSLVDGALGRIEWREYTWSDEDFSGMRLAIGAFDAAAEAKAFSDAARARNIPVNVVDRPEFCDFQFGALVNRSPLVVAISTDGAAPVFAQALRARIEGLLPNGFSDWVSTAKTWRTLPALREASASLRRNFWSAYARLAFSRPQTAPSEEDREVLMSQVLSGGGKTGRVSLVGAGPGNPELLTLKAVRLLQAADVILYDHLVSQEILDFARREAKRMLVGKTGYGPSCKQDDINRMMVSLAREGRHVVRLKGGDPGIFGRAGEEIAACRAAGIAVEIVPGITTAQGAAADLGISLTHRDHAQRVQFVTGHARSGTLPESIRWEAIADGAATTIIYMPRKTLGGLRDAALQAGLSPDTPAAAVFSATRENSRTFIATIATLPEQLEAIDLDGPVIVMIGSVLNEVAALADDVTESLVETVPQRSAGAA